MTAVGDFFVYFCSGVSFFETDSVTGGFALTGKSSSGLGVVYASGNANILRVDGTNAIMRGRGTNTITARQAGNTNYFAAGNVVRTIVIK